MTSQTAPRGAGSVRREEARLDRNYGRIGISAVAAAVRFQGAPDNTADRGEDEAKDRKPRPHADGEAA